MLKDLPCGLILLYHRLGRPAQDPWNLFVEPDTFAAQMEALARFWPVVSVSEGLRRLDQRVSGHWVAVTFDDAYREVSELAVPRLQKQQQLTVFACTHEPDREFWWDRLADPGFQPALRRSAHPQVAQPNTGSSPRMSPAELAVLAQEHEVGNHTHRHLSLRALSEEQQREEIRTARALLEEWTGRLVPGLAYPFGDLASERALDGCAWACTVSPSLVWRGTPRFRLPRYWAPTLQGEEFLQWLRAQGLS